MKNTTWFMKRVFTVGKVFAVASIICWTTFQRMFLILGGRFSSVQNYTVSNVHCLLYLVKFRTRVVYILRRYHILSVLSRKSFCRTEAHFSERHIQIYTLNVSSVWENILFIVLPWNMFSYLIRLMLFSLRTT